MSERAEITMHRVISLPTPLGQRTFTDLTILWKGEHYGSRQHGGMMAVEATVQAMRIVREHP